MGGVFLGSKKYYYKTKEFAREAMLKAMDEQVSVSEIRGENAVFVGLPNEPVNKAAANALRRNCVRIDQFQEIPSNSDSSAAFEGDLPPAAPNEKDWVTIEHDLGKGLERVVRDDPEEN